MKRFFLKWILIGLFLRLALMPFTAHSDMVATDLGAYLISQKGEIINFYDHKNDSVVFNYPPLAYLTPGVFMWLLSPLYDFPSNLKFINGSRVVYGTLALYKNLFLLKFPYLIFDFLLAYFLFILFKENGKKAFKLWMVNPLTLYATFAMGQFDLMPTLCVVAAILLLKNKRNLPAAVVLGFGGAFKLFPLLLLPTFALIAEKNLWRLLKMIAIGLGCYLVIITPYFLFSSGYRQTALLASQTDKMLFAKVPVSGAEYISLFFLGYFFILYFAVRSEQRTENFWRFGIVILLLFFSITHYHPQWFIWITPFLIWDYIIYGIRHRAHILIIFVCHVLLTFFFEGSLHIGLFSPVLPSLRGAGSLADIFLVNSFLIKSLLRTLLAATAAFLMFDIFKFRNEAKVAKG